MKTCMLLGLAALMLARTASAAVPEAQRRAELAERKKDMEADSVALKKRLTRVPASIETFRAELKKLPAAKGINATGIVFGPAAALEAMAENRRIDSGDGNAFDALVAFSKDLKARGVDLMVVPYPTHAEVYGHRLVKGGKPDDELWPAKVEGLIKLLENDVEVIECGDAFKAYTGKGRVLGAFDHHFDSAGIEILATELGRRIRKRYDFAREGETGRKLFTTQEIQIQTPSFFLQYNGISADEARALSIPPTLPVQQVTYNGTVDLGTRIDPVLMMGDSSVWGPYPKGWGIVNHVSKELGWLVPYSSDHWGAHRQCGWYVRSHANTIPQPRVLIVVMVGYSLYFNDAFLGRWSIAHLPPPPAGPGSTATPGQAPVKPAEAKPFRATVKLTKVSAPPDPKETPYTEAFTVSEAQVTRLWSKTADVAVGDTILLVEWVMKDRKVLPHIAVRKVGLSGTVTLTRWEKRLNAADEDTRMIVDDTENYDAGMYWVGEGAK